MPRFVLCDKFDKKVISKLRWDCPAHNPETHIVLQVDEDVFNVQSDVQRWDGADGLRIITTEERDQDTATKVAAAFNELDEHNRSLLYAIVNEINILRDWIADFKVDVVAATDLNDLQTRMAAKTDLPNCTVETLLLPASSSGKITP